MDCIFCKIINKDIPSTIVYEDDFVIAINDISPQAPVHIIVFPKEHIETLNQLTEDKIDIAGKLLVSINKIAKQECLDNGYRIVSNCGEDGGQTVNHIHIHLLAKRKLAWPPG